MSLSTRHLQPEPALKIMDLAASAIALAVLKLRAPHSTVTDFFIFPMLCETKTNPEGEPGRSSKDTLCGLLQPKNYSYVRVCLLLRICKIT